MRRPCSWVLRLLLYFTVQSCNKPLPSQHARRKRWTGVSSAIVVGFITSVLSPMQDPRPNPKRSGGTDPKKRGNILRGGVVVGLCLAVWAACSRRPRSGRRPRPDRTPAIRRCRGNWAAEQAHASARSDYDGVHGVSGVVGSATGRRGTRAVSSKGVCGPNTFACNGSR